jgi:hypothetical protein
MRLAEYQEYLQGQDIPIGTIEKRMVMVADFARFLIALGLKDTSTAGKEVVERFVRQLIAERSDTLENLSNLCDYADWLGYRKLYVALVEVVDCHNAMEV